MAAGQQRGRIGPGLVAFVVVDVLLVALLAVVAVLYATGGESTPRSPSPTGSESAPADAGGPSPSSTDAGALDAFVLPSGNIGCTLGPEGVTCTIASFTYEAPEVAGCTGQTGHVLTLTAEGVAFTCEPADETPAPPAGAPVLPYGSQTTQGAYTCRSATDGVTCQTSDGTGFRLARGSYATLP